MNKFFNSIEFNFKDISNMIPPDKKKSGFVNFVSDDTAYEFNPSRYNFYMQFIEGLNDPEVLKKVLYANSLIKSNKKLEDNNLKDIVDGLKTLYMHKRQPNISDQNFLEGAKKKKEKINKEVADKVKFALEDRYDTFSNKNKIDETIDKTFGNYKKTTTGGAKEDDTPKKEEDTVKYDIQKIGDKAVCSEELNNINIITVYEHKIRKDIQKIVDNLNKIIDIHIGTSILQQRFETKLKRPISTDISTSTDIKPPNDKTMELVERIKALEKEKEQLLKKPVEIIKEKIIEKDPIIKEVDDKPVDINKILNDPDKVSKITNEEKKRIEKKQEDIIKKNEDDIKVYYNYFRGFRDVSLKPLRYKDNKAIMNDTSPEKILSNKDDDINFLKKGGEPNKEENTSPNEKADIENNALEIKGKNDKKKKVLIDSTEEIGRLMKLDKKNVEKILNLFDKRKEDLIKPLQSYYNEIRMILYPSVKNEKTTGGNIDSQIKEMLGGGDKELSGILSDTQYQQLNDLIYRIENDPLLSISNLEISREDRLVFIAITFLIRMISLSFIEWGMNTNFITTFEESFMFYCVIYIVIFCLITMIVNIIYNYPLSQVFSDDSSLVDIPSMLYYFYIYTNGIMRLVLHLSLILILMIIPFVIKHVNNTKPNFDYETKKKTRKVLSNFSLVIWLLTSLIAIRF